MKKYVLLSLVSGGLLFATAPVVLAVPAAQSPMTQTASTTAMPAPAVDMSTVVQNLEGAGYKAIEKIRRHGDVYKAEVFDTAGKEFKVSLDSKTGKITDTKATKASESAAEVEKFKAKKTVSPTDALGRVMAAGYKDVSMFETEANFYEVDASDTKGKKVTLMVDGATGTVTPAGHKLKAHEKKAH